VDVRGRSDEAPDRYRVWPPAELLEAVFATLPRLAGVTRGQIDASAAAVERVRRADCARW
jgi:hypothetical protein